MRESPGNPWFRGFLLREIQPEQQRGGLTIDDHLRLDTPSAVMALPRATAKLATLMQKTAA
jgi:hypothetical protein